MSELQDFTKDAAPFTWRSCPTAPTSTPAAAKRAMSASAGAGSAVSSCPTLPWSAKARSASSGIVLTVYGAASPST
jgi:hypothetical protein